jgi:hypothetical protein
MVWVVAVAQHSGDGYIFLNYNEHSYQKVSFKLEVFVELDLLSWANYYVRTAYVIIVALCGE